MLTFYAECVSLFISLKSESSLSIIRQLQNFFCNCSVEVGYTRGLVAVPKIWNLVRPSADGRTSGGAAGKGWFRACPQTMAFPSPGGEGRAVTVAVQALAENLLPSVPFFSLSPPAP